MRDKVSGKKIWFIALGIIFLISGVLAIVFPFFSSLAIDVILGAILVATGVFHIIISMTIGRWRGFF